jgi:hypothetical protein
MSQVEVPNSLRTWEFGGYAHYYEWPKLAETVIEAWEAIMKTNILLHADHQLDQLAGQFDHWRQNRSHPGERIPQRLWDQAAALARLLPYSRVAQHVRVSPSDLKKHIAALHDATPAAPAASPPFVEVPAAPVWPPATAAMEIEMERPDGARLRLRCPETTLSVTALVRVFLEGVR